MSQREEERRFILEKGLDALFDGRDPTRMLNLFGRALELRLGDMDLLIRDVLREAFIYWKQRPTKTSDDAKQDDVASAA